MQETAMFIDPDGQPVIEMTAEEIAQLLNQITNGQNLQVDFDEEVQNKASTFISPVLDKGFFRELEEAPSYVGRVRLNHGIQIWPRVWPNIRRYFKDWILTTGWGNPDTCWGRVIRVSLYTKNVAPIIRTLPPRNPAESCAS